jgi:magnesium chelatase subunit D
MDQAFVKKTYPFTAVCGQDEFKLALLLAAIDPTLGGVLVLGDKGSAKTTTVRAMSQLLHSETNTLPFVNLPIGATEDRVLGSVDLEILINEKRMAVHKGLLAAAHNGLLYIDEINLLNDYIMDLLLDASSGGGYYLEREGLSAWQNSRFILIGTMNPEEGELRPQLLDRFGLCVTVKTPSQTALRAEIIRRRLLFDADADTFIQQYAEQETMLSDSIYAARKNLLQVTIPDSIYEEAAGFCLAQQTEGMRADILIVKAARALVAFEQRSAITKNDLKRVAPLVLAHRGKKENTSQQQQRGGGESPRSGDNEVQHKPEKEQASNEQTTTGNSNQSSALQEYLFKSIAVNAVVPVNRVKESMQNGLNSAKQKLVSATMQSGREDDRKRDLVKTVQHFLIHHKCSIQYKQPAQPAEVRLLFLVDSSSSMSAGQQISLVKGMISTLAQRFKNKRPQIALVALFQGVARLVMEFTDNIEQVLLQLAQLRTGGKTNMAAGFEQVNKLMRIKKRWYNSFLYIFTDGRINAGRSAHPFQEAVLLFRQQLHRLRAQTYIVDTETGLLRMGMAERLSKAIGCRYLLVENKNSII